MLTVHQTPRDGNCLFASVAKILQSCPTHWKVANSRNLREVVASSVYDEKDTDVLQALEMWQDIYEGAVRERDIELQVEFRHAHVLCGHSRPFHESVRRDIHAQMLKKSYWGDVFAIGIFEKQLKIQFLILMPSSSGTERWILHSPVSRRDQRGPFAILRLFAKHYQPVSEKGKFIFMYSTLPSSIRGLLDKNI